MAAATLTLLVLSLTSQAVALRSDKPFVTTEERAQVEFSVLDDSGRPLRDAQVSLTVNVGSVTEPALAQDGTFRATYQPAPGEGAQVALFHATVRQGARSSGAWLALPVHGPYLLRVQAPPRAQVTVSIGAASYGPVSATARGEATVPVRLPPGAVSAQVTITPRSGKSRTQTVPLPEPRFARVRLVALETPVQGQPVRLQGFVVDESGNPAVALPPLAVSTEQGTLGPIEAREGGVFELPYTASAGSEAPVNISASPLEESARSSTLQVKPLPAPAGPPGDSEATASQTPVSPEGPLASSAQWTRWQPTLGAFLFAHSNAAAAKGLGLQFEGALRLAASPWEALLVVELRQNATERESVVSEGEDPVTKTFTLGGAGARLGARWSRPLLTRGLLFADASVGVLSMSGSVKLESKEGTSTRELRSVGPDIVVGGGFGWAVGPGRLSGELQWAYAPGRARVGGNLGGLSLGVGYQLSFGGRPSP